MLAGGPERWEEAFREQLRSNRTFICSSFCTLAVRKYILEVYMSALVLVGLQCLRDFECLVRIRGIQKCCGRASRPTFRQNHSAYASLLCFARSFHVLLWCDDVLFYSRTI